MGSIKLSNGKTVTFEPVTSNMVAVKSNSAHIKYEEDKFITFDNLLTINIGDEVEAEINGYTKKYVVNHITHFDGGHILIERKINITTLFCIATLGFDRITYLFDTHLVNAYYYIDKEIYEDSDDLMYLLYKFSNSDEFLKFEESIKNHPLFVSILDPNPNYIVVVMKINENFMPDIKNVMDGKYSKTSKAFQSRAYKFHKLSEMDVMGQVFNKCEERRINMSEDLGFEVPKGSELLDIPDKKNETLCL